MNNNSCRDCEFACSGYCVVCSFNPSKEKEMNEQSSKKFWMVCGPFNSPKYRHPTELSAQQEADRLAKMHPGDAFFVMEAIGVSIQKSSTYNKL